MSFQPVSTPGEYVPLTPTSPYTPSPHTRLEPTTILPNHNSNVSSVPRDDHYAFRGRNILHRRRHQHRVSDLELAATTTTSSSNELVNRGMLQHQPDTGQSWGPTALRTTVQLIFNITFWMITMTKSGAKWAWKVVGIDAEQMRGIVWYSVMAKVVELCWEAAVEWVKEWWRRRWGGGV